MKYTDLLAQHKIDPTKLSPALKRLVKQHDDVENEITKAETKLQSGNLSVTRKGKLEEDLAEARETLDEVNDALCSGIEKWVKDRPKNLAKGQALKASREGKKNNTASSTPAGSGAATPAATAATTQTPDDTGTPAATTPASAAPADNSVQQKPDENHTPEKKKGNPGWIIPSIFITALLLIGGVVYHNNQKSTI